ncbi:MAG: hypothetical protein ACI9BD_000066 [Candidatus Marinamargulisbacteria bacterium]|jgi:hypothetical protein
MKKINLCSALLILGLTLGCSQMSTKTDPDRNTELSRQMIERGYISTSRSADPSRFLPEIITNQTFTTNVTKTALEIETFGDVRIMPGAHLFLRPDFQATLRAGFEVLAGGELDVSFANH